jgi:hypothetical protein
MSFSVNAFVGIPIVLLRNRFQQNKFQRFSIFAYSVESRFLGTEPYFCVKALPTYLSTYVPTYIHACKECPGLLLATVTLS